MKKEGFRAVVMGGSAGALDALSRILPRLPGNYSLPILVVVHLPPDKNSVLAELLQSKCALKVREAEDKEDIEAGTAYFAPPDYHLQVEAGGYVSLSYDAPQLFSRPSIDVLFESAADVYGPDLVGVVLSGANNDGAQGLKAITLAGGAVLVQAPGSAYAGAMPEAALEECPAAKVLSPEEIAEYLKTEAIS